MTTKYLIDQHGLTQEQVEHVQALACKYGVNMDKLDRWTPSLSIVGGGGSQNFMHVRHCETVLHVDVFTPDGSCIVGSSWALAPEGEQYAKRGVLDLSGGAA